MKTLVEFLNESPKQLVDVAFGDSKRLGQSRIMGAIMGILTHDLNNPSPRFGIKSTVNNLIKAGVSKPDVQKLRDAVIRGMQATIKKNNIPKIYIEDLPNDLFERYRFNLEGYSPNAGDGDIHFNLRQKNYLTARKEILKEVEKLNIKLNK